LVIAITAFLVGLTGVQRVGKSPGLFIEPGALVAGWLQLKVGFQLRKPAPETRRLSQRCGQLAGEVRLGFEDLPSLYVLSELVGRELCLPCGCGGGRQLTGQSLGVDAMTLIELRDRSRSRTADCSAASALFATSAS
jgi:hypothetical protein